MPMITSHDHQDGIAYCDGTVGVVTINSRVADFEKTDYDLTFERLAGECRT